MITTVRGFRDIIAPESARFAEFETLARRIMELYSYTEIRLPAVERKELFVKSTGESTDIVEKEMYEFDDAGGRRLALRPEGTPGVVRAYLENNMHAEMPVRKLFYVGSMYRAERPQKGRFREFEQIGAEYIGNCAPSADAETIIMLDCIFKSAGLKNAEIEINSLGCPQCRPAYKEKLLNFLKENRASLCENCQNRLERNPLRALDCKIDGAVIADKAPKQELCAECAAHFDEVQKLLSISGVAVKINRNMVRGLDYYSRTVFEFKAENAGAQNAVAGGGRYDNLIKSMGGPDIPAVGWAMGVDRVISAIADNASVKPPTAFAVSMCEGAGVALFKLMGQLRQAGIKADGGLFSQSGKAQMKAAGKTGAKYALIIGDDELAKNAASVKNMETGEQTQISIDKVLEFFKEI